MSKIIYDENNKLYKIDGSDTIYESDVSINKNNDLRKLADVTTLGNSDINLLHQYAKIRFDNILSIEQFKNEPLKILFPNIPKNKLCINKLMMISYDYVIDNKIENFDDDYYGNDSNKNDDCLIMYIYLVIIIILLTINTSLIYYLYTTL
jgi:hypothetical protein